METFLAVVVIFVIAILGMAVGVIFSNRCLRGSCGGLGGMRDEHGRSICDACTTPSETCAGRLKDDAAPRDADPVAAASHEGSETHSAHR